MDWPRPLELKLIPVFFLYLELGLTISRSIFISREREFPKHFGYFPGISRELKTYLIANRKYPIFERKCIFWGSRIILSFVTIIFDSKVWFWAQRKISKIEWNRKICQSQYIKISRNFPGNRKNSRDQAGLKIFGKFPGFPGREFPGTSPNFQPLWFSIFWASSHYRWVFIVRDKIRGQ